MQSAFSIENSVAKTAFADHRDANIAHSLDQPLEDHRREAQRVEMDEIVRPEPPGRQPDQPTLVEGLVDDLAAMRSRKTPSPHPGRW